MTLLCDCFIEGVKEEGWKQTKSPAVNQSFKLWDKRWPLSFCKTLIAFLSITVETKYIAVLELCAALIWKIKMNKFKVYPVLWTDAERK